MWSGKFKAGPRGESVLHWFCWPSKHLFIKHLLFPLHGNCLPTLWSFKPLPSTPSLVFSWKWYLRWVFGHFGELLSFPRSLQGFSSVQFSHSVVSDSLQPHGPRHVRPPCPSPTPRVYSNSCPLSQWCHPTISSSVVPFSSHPQSFPA